MENLFVKLLFGHLLGDFIFQNKWMAVNKSASHFKTFVHVSIYTFCVLLTTWTWDIKWALVVFVPHFLIDRYSLADKWLDLINGRSLKDFYHHGHKEIPKGDKMLNGNYRILRGGFTSVVYTVVDNTMHLLCMWYGWKFLMEGC